MLCGILVPEQISDRAVPSYLFKPMIPIQTRRNSSHPDAILVTPHPTNPKRPPTPPSHRVLCSMGSTTTPARHIHSIEIKYCEDTRPSAQLEASHQQHSKLCKQLQRAEITIHPILLGVGGTIYTVHTLDQFKQLGIDSQKSETLARKLHARSLQFAHKLTSTRRAIENNNTHHNTGALEQ
eukprot:846217-Pelagomonas_calceolata.AAC.1